MAYDTEDVSGDDGVRLVLIHRRLETTDTVLSVSGGWQPLREAGILFRKIDPDEVAALEREFAGRSDD